MRQLKHTAKVFNATFETLTIPIHSRYWTFEPRSYTEVEESYLEPIEKEHATKGLIIVEDGDNVSEKEKSALLAYRQRLLVRKKNYQDKMDEEKKLGSTMEEPVGMRLCKKWIDQIETRYSVIQELMQENDSFLELDKKEEKITKQKKAEAQVAV